MKQFLKNIGAMLYVFVVYKLVFGIVALVCSMLSVLPTVWLVIVGVFLGGLLFSLLVGLSGAAVYPALKWINGTISGKIMCTISSLLVAISCVFEAIKMVNEYNTMNTEGQTQYLAMTIIAATIFMTGVIAGTIVMWRNEQN